MLRRFAAVLPVLLAAACGSVAISSQTSASAAGSGGLSGSSSVTSGAGGSGTPDAGTDGGDGGPADAGEGVGDAGDPGAAVLAEADPFCTSFAEWYCGFAPSCGCSGSTATCPKALRAQCLETVLFSSGVVFRADHAAACLAALQASPEPCVNTVHYDAWQTCPSALASLEPLGSTCQDNGHDCASGDGTCADGTCVPHPGVGDACSSPGNPAGCPLGAFCNAAGVCQVLGNGGAVCGGHGECAPGFVCGGNVCVLTVGAGAPCDAGALCGADLYCTNGTCQTSPASCTISSGSCGTQGITACFPDEGGSSQCVPASPQGGPCGGPTPSCDTGLACNQILGGQCEPLPGAGESCPMGVCQTGLGCSVNGFCQSPASEAQPCNYGPNVAQCAAGLACSGAPGAPSAVCVAIAGPLCKVDGDCAPGERCADAGVCRTPVEIGDLCDATLPCPSGAVCDSEAPWCPSGETCGATLCRQVVGAGAACPDDFTACATGLACVEDSTGHGTCQPPPMAGQSCGVDGRCADGLVCQSMSGGGGFSGTCYPLGCIWY